MQNNKIDERYSKLRKRISEYYGISEMNFEMLPQCDKECLAVFVGAKEYCHEIRNLLKRIGN